MLKESRLNFDPAHALLTLTMVCIRISELPVKYFDTSFLMQLDAKIGHPIKVDNISILR